MKHRNKLLAATAASGLLIGMVGAVTAPSVSADSSVIDFETSFVAGSPNSQEGWVSTGAFDHKIVDNVGAPSSFGTKSLRVSNAVTSGSFGDQTFSKALANAAGESTAADGGVSGGSRQAHFSAQWQFTSTLPTEQTGLAVVASPDRGDGARMGWVQMADTSTGLEVRFNDYRDEHVVGSSSNLAQGCAANDDFFQTTIASGLARDQVHTVKISLDFLEGPRNDVVRVWVDGALAHVGTSWEDYFRYCEETDTSRTVDSILFRTAGTAAPATLGNGFLIDNLELSSGPITTSVSDGSWTLYPEQAVDTDTDSVITTAYRAKARAPINADGTSNFPKRRGVIPIQFDLESATRTVVTETTTTGPVVFESIGSDTSTDNDYSFLRFTPDTRMRFADLNQLVAHYDFTTGNCVAGSLRWQVRIDVGNDGVEANDGNLFVYFGDAPAFNDCDGAASNSGQNLIGNSDARFDLTQLGGPFYGTYADALALIGTDDVLRASLVLDSGWSTDQVVTLTGAGVDGSSWTPTPAGTVTHEVSDTTTAYAKTCALPQAKLTWGKTDGQPSGDLNEAESIQPKDSGVYYRNVDCKYIYNLDVSSLGSNLATRAGTYRVWVNIDGANIPNPAVFDLK